MADERLGGPGPALSGEWGPGRGSSLPGHCASAKSLLSTSQDPLTEAGTDGLAQNLDTLPRHFGKASAGRAGLRRETVPEPQRRPSLCSPACPWPLKCTGPGTDPGARARAHTRTHNHTHSYPSGTPVTSEGSAEEVGGLLAPALHGLQLPEGLSQREPGAVVGKLEGWWHDTGTPPIRVSTNTL